MSLRSKSILVAGLVPALALGGHLQSQAHANSYADLFDWTGFGVYLEECMIEGCTNEEPRELYYNNYEEEVVAEGGDNEEAQEYGADGDGTATQMGAISSEGEHYDAEELKEIGYDGFKGWARGKGLATRH